ncbi:hypothetical protein LR48_Vigan01g266900 [Vigna angularis]|uniref:Uncharacterized protein n=1 Tax=Phaseolus angularis TaxID=3914 RepID=A0A0L9TR99_PHAAN|nr:hypothetical protein LR48_Vigan01g266900 [Vigna angularis]
MDLQEMEEARKAYMAAVAITKERQDEESIGKKSILLVFNIYYHLLPPPPITYHFQRKSIKIDMDKQKTQIVKKTHILPLCYKLGQET